MPAALSLSWPRPRPELKARGEILQKPFRKELLIERLTRLVGNWSIRRNPLLRRSYDYWLSKAAGRPYPDRADLNPAKIQELLPHLVIIGVEGLPGALTFRFRLMGKERVIAFRMGAETCHAALRKFGTVKRLGIITPTPRSATPRARKSFDCGYEILVIKGLRCGTPTQAAHVSEKELRDALDQLDNPMLEAIVQFRANLAMARVAAKAEFWMDIPVIAVNPATYWRVLRRAGIDDKVFGFGALLEDF